MTPSDLPAADLRLAGMTWFPDWVVVLQGRAAAAEPVAGLEVVRARGAGDDRIVQEVVRLRADARPVIRGDQRSRTRREGARTGRGRRARWLVDRLG